ncbi:hypothetical protein MSSIH_1816 [Methanosarcina siciliae HI350]|uniref:SMODS-associated and fused to various effectors domain-containing protein n=1 Tax=Methanosarcina siciliae HI350 TaxID=1434119 RepID=A0A0E3LAS0_9EURY|nr:SAVED domain-containing protein [Methanosarcina siciliae]AKB32506.1 hypothetical protein MSSIH_1816 [Methanosarcina siciliae HI350]
MLKRLYDFYECTSIIAKRKYDTLIGLFGLTLALFGNFHYIFKLFVVIVILVLLQNRYVEAKKTLKTFEEKHLPIMILVGKSEEEYNSMVSDILFTMNEYGFDESSFHEDFEINRDSWLIRKENNLSYNDDDWEDLVVTFKNKIYRLSEKLKGRKVFHIFFNGPSVLAMGMGASIGTKHEIVLHHYQTGAGNTPYLPLIDFYSKGDSNLEGSLELKSKIEGPNQYIQIQEQKMGFPSAMVSICIGSRDPAGNIERISKLRQSPVSLIHLRNKLGNLPINANWVRATQEVANYLLKLSSDKNTENIELYMNMPAIIAFALGMAVGTQSPISLYNWFSDSKDYHCVLKLNQLCKYK